jgi:hypothetical protein
MVSGAFLSRRSSNLGGEAVLRIDLGEEVFVRSNAGVMVRKSNASLPSALLPEPTGIQV